MKSTGILCLITTAAFAVLTGSCSKPPADTEALVNANRKIAELEAALAKGKSDVQQQTQQQPPSSVPGDYIATGYLAKGGKLTISKTNGSLQILGFWELGDDPTSPGYNYASKGSITNQELRFIDSAFDKAKIHGDFFWRVENRQERRAAIREQAANLVIEKDAVKVICPGAPEAVMVFKKTW